MRCIFRNLQGYTEERQKAIAATPFPSGYPVHSIMMGWIYEFGSKSCRFWPLSQYVTALLAFFFPCQGVKDVQLQRDNFCQSDCSIKSLIKKTWTFCDLQEILGIIFLSKKKKIFYLQNCEHLSVSLSISLLIGGPQPSGWMSGK